MMGLAFVASLAAAIMGAPAPSSIALRWQRSLDVSKAQDGLEGLQVLGVADGLAVIRHDDDFLLFRTDTGAPAGKLTLGDAPVIFAAGQLVVLDRDELVAHAVAADGFQKRWQVPVLRRALLPFGTWLTSAESGRTVLLTGGACGDGCPNEGNPHHAGELVAVDVTAGTTRWRSAASDEAGIDALATAGDRFIVASRCEAIARAADTGRVLWRTGRCHSNSDQKAIVTSAGDAVFFTPGGRQLARLQRTTGHRRWEVGLGGMEAVALAATDDAVYVALREGTRFARPRPIAVRALDAATGRRLWEHAFDVRRLLVADRHSLVVEEMGADARTRLSLVDRTSGDVRDAFRVGRGGGVEIEHPPAGPPRLVVGSSVGVLGLGLAERPATSTPRRIPGRLTGAGGAPLAGFPILYEARAPGWPTRTVTTDAKGEFEITVDAPDIVPIWLQPDAVEHHRAATGRGNRRWSCLSEPDVHYVVGPRAGAPARLDTALFCFDPLD
jgi:outer membrane protein assembly factor BamB